MRRKNIGVFVLLCTITISAFAESFSITLDGNAHIFSYNDLKKILSMNCAIYTANELYRSYENLRNSCGNNKLLLEQKEKNEFANQLIKISGKVKQVRKSILDEYIVELYTSDSIFYDIGVVYPKRISQKMINELMTYKQGDYFQATVLTRRNDMYVDVPVWNSNGTYRTEP